VVGATSVIRQAQRSGKASPWLANLLKRKPPKLAAEAGRRGAGQQNGPRRLEADGHRPKLRPQIRACQFRERGLEIGQGTGSTLTATVLSRCQNLQGKEQMV